MKVPATMAALGGDKVRRKLPELATEALMVVFAVLVALGVEEWREERQLRAFADRARAAVDQEIELNLEEFRNTESRLAEGSESVATLLRPLLEARESGESGSVEGGFTFAEPEISMAAWRVAQASRAAPYFDYDWVIGRARHYERVERYADLWDQFMEGLAAVDAASTANDLDAIVTALSRTQGQLRIIRQHHEQLQEQMEGYLGATEAEQETEAPAATAPRR